jgi:hypothetical protein
MHRILIVAHAFPPENLAGAARPFRFSRYLPEFGYCPQILTASVQDPEHPPKNVYYVPDRVAASPPRSLLRLSEEVLRRLNFPGDANLPWLIDASRAIKGLMREVRFAAIYSTSPPLGAHLLALLIKRRYGVPWVADFRDPLVGNAFRPIRGLPALIDARIERAIFRHANKIVGVTDRFVEDWSYRYPQFADKMHIIWNGFDPADPVRPLPLPPGHRKVLAHIGEIYGARSPLPVVASIRRLIEAGHISSKQIRIRLIGDFARDALTACMPAFADLTKLGCLEYENRRVERDEARAAIAQSDCLLLLDNNATNIGQTVPSKLFEYIQVGRPIVALTTLDSPVARILRQSGTPYAEVQQDMPAPEIDRRILALLALPTHPVAPNAWFSRNFDAREQTAQLAGIFDSLLQTGSHTSCTTAKYTGS